MRVRYLYTPYIVAACSLLFDAWIVCLCVCVCVSCACSDSALLTKFFPEMAFRTAALECLTEIAGLVDLDPRYNTLFQNMFVVLVKQVSNSTYSL